MDKLIAYAAGNEINLWQALHPADGMPPATLKKPPGKAGRFCGHGGSVRYGSQWHQCPCPWPRHCQTLWPGARLVLSDKTPEVARYENVQELLNALQGFVENPLNEKPKACPTS